MAEQSFAGRAGLPVVRNGFLDQAFVVRHLGGLEDQRGIGRCVLRGVIFKRGEVAGISDNPGELFELVQLVDDLLGLFFFKFNNAAHKI